MKQKELVIMFGILVVVLIITLAIFLFNPAKQSEYKYNGFLISKFRLRSAPDVLFYNVDLFVGKNKYSISFRNDPNELETIPITGLNDVSWLKKSDDADNYGVKAEEIFVTFDPEDANGNYIIAGGELVRVLGLADYSIYKIRTTGAFIKEVENSDSPVKTCDDANYQVGIILLKLGTEDKVFTENDCIIVQGSTYNGLIKASDRLLLSLLGVIPA